MTKPAIKKITVLCRDGAYITYEHNVNNVTEIRDKTVEYESSIEFIYYVMNGETVIAELINVPVIVERFN